MSELSTLVRRTRDDFAARASRLVDTAEAEHRALSPTEAAEHTALLADVADATTRLAELEGSEARNAASAALRVATGDTGTNAPSVTVRSEPHTYRKGDPESPSYIRDLVMARTQGHPDSWERLRRCQREEGRETRALGNTGGVGGSFGELAPPAWLVSDLITLARPGRPTADLFNHQVLPRGVSTINIPRVATGTTALTQTSQNTALSQTDPTTTSVSASVTTIGGKAVISQQLIDQSPVNLDEILIADLAADYARSLDLQVLAGTGLTGQLKGLLGVAGINNVAFTSATPKVAGAGGLYGVMAQALALINTTRFLPAECWVMSPSRWSWMLASYDTQSRPLFLSGVGQLVNGMGVASRVAAENVVGVLHGLPVVLDSAIPVTGGQDVIIAARFSDLWLYESEVFSDVLTQPMADTLGVLVRFWAYSASLPQRYPASVCTITGTGLASPPVYT